MPYIVDFGPDTNSETFESFETEKKKFMKNNIKEV